MSKRLSEEALADVFVAVEEARRSGAPVAVDLATISALAWEVGDARDALEAIAEGKPGSEAQYIAQCTLGGKEW